MKIQRLFPVLLCLLPVAGGLAACSDDDPVAPGPGGDRTPPQVILTAPRDGEGGADLHEPLIVVFSEPMDPTTAAGNVALVGGAVTTLDWESPGTLTVGHDGFAEGDTVTLTLGAGLADAAGNRLGADHAVSFRTTSSTELVVMDMSPAHGSSGVPVNTGIVLRFSEFVSRTQVENRVFLSDIIVTGAEKAQFAFTVQSLRYNSFLLAPDEDLPAETLVYVYVSDLLTAEGGQTLAEPLLLTFTTGSGVDTAPPVIVATDPANGAVDVSPGQGFVRITFDEPVRRMGLIRQNHTWRILTERPADLTAQWNADQTQLTFALPPDLPAGTPVDLTWGRIEDYHGNQQTEPYRYRFAVAGEPDYLPYEGGERLLDLFEWHTGPVGSEEATDSGGGRHFMLIDEQADGSYRETVCFNRNPAGDPFAVLTDQWEAFRETGDALRWLGWQEDPGLLKSNDLAAPLTVLPLPLAAGTWNAVSTVTLDGGGTSTISLEGRVLAKQDFTIPESAGETFIKDAWIAVLDYTEEQEGEVVTTGRDSVFYAPNLGPVRAVAYEEDRRTDTWRRELAWRWYYSEQLLFNAQGYPVPATHHR